MTTSVLPLPLPPQEEGIIESDRRQFCEITLLLTQTEALSYAWHLAKVAGENEPEPGRARALAGLSEDMQNLYQEVFVLLLSKTTTSATL